MFNPIQIATKRNSRPRKGATRRSAPPPRKKVAWWLWLIIPLIVAVFVYGLSQLSQVKPEPVSAPLPVNKPKAEKKPAPKKPATTQKKETQKKDNFEFYQILQDSEVDTSHVDAYQSTPRGEQDFYYMIQAASFRSASDADRMRANLILSGLPEASIRETTGQDNRPWYRVVLGPYESRSLMNRAEDKLVAMDISSYSYKVKKEE